MKINKPSKLSGPTPYVVPVKITILPFNSIKEIVIIIGNDKWPPTPDAVDHFSKWFENHINNFDLVQIYEYNQHRILKPSTFQPTIFYNLNVNNLEQEFSNILPAHHNVLFWVSIGDDDHFSYIGGNIANVCSNIHYPCFGPDQKVFVTDCGVNCYYYS